MAAVINGVTRELLEVIEMTWRVNYKGAPASSDLAAAAIVKGLAQIRDLLAAPSHEEVSDQAPVEWPEGGSDTVEAVALGAFDSLGQPEHDLESWCAGYAQAIYKHAKPGDVQFELGDRPCAGPAPAPAPAAPELIAVLSEFVSAARSVNRGKSHEVRGLQDSEPCYWQRKEWIDWLVILGEQGSAAIAAHSAGQEVQ